MSADLFRPRAAGDATTRIPAPSGFRRSMSLRLRGERRPPSTSQHSLGVVATAAAPGVTTAGLSRPRFHNTDHHAVNGLRADSGGLSSGNRSRSLSLSLSTSRLCTSSASPRTPPTSPDGVRRLGHHLQVPPRPHRRSYNDDDDLDSLRSFGSIASTASCDHPFVAHNGTTFSGRRMKYVVHCSSHAGQTGDEYLTPTQRAQKQIKRLKFLLQQAKQDIEQKDSDIFRLTKEVVELRVFKATLSSPEDKSNSSEAVTVRENATDDMKTPDSPTCTDFTDDPKTPFEKSVVDMQSSFADSGHFEDLNNSKDSVHVSTCDKAVMVRLGSDDDQRIVEMYEKKLEDLIRVHGDETQELKHRHNEKIEELLQKLSDVNLRYCHLVPNFDQARERIQELEKQLDVVNRQLEEQEEKNKQLYLQMYNKGVEAAKLEQKEQVLALAVQSPSRVSVSELLQQLQVTQTELDNIKAMYRRLVELKNSKNVMDPEITLQFLKSAIYYFLTDKENHQGHLRAIQSILGFSQTEISNIDKARTS